MISSLSNLKAALEPVVVTAIRGVRWIIDNSVRLRTVTLDEPFALGSLDTEFRAYAIPLSAWVLLKLSQTSTPHIRMPITSMASKQ